jgi:hypothetical protein
MRKAITIPNSIIDLCSFETKFMHFLNVVLPYNLYFIFRNANIFNEVIFQAMSANWSITDNWWAFRRGDFNSS